MAGCQTSSKRRHEPHLHRENLKSHKLNLILTTLFRLQSTSSKKKVYRPYDTVQFRIIPKIMNLLNHLLVLLDGGSALARAVPTENGTTQKNDDKH